MRARRADGALFAPRGAHVAKVGQLYVVTCNACGPDANARPTERNAAIEAYMRHVAEMHTEERRV